MRGAKRLVRSRRLGLTSALLLVLAGTLAGKLPASAATLSPACVAANTALGRTAAVVTTSKASVRRAKRVVTFASRAVTKAKRSHRKRMLVKARAVLVKAAKRLVKARSALAKAGKLSVVAAKAQVSACAVVTKPPVKVPTEARGGLYVAMGDSITRGACCDQPTDPAQTYVGLVNAHFQTTLGVTELSNLARDGESAATIRTSGQLAAGLAAINAPTNTRVVTIGIGGYEMALGGCGFGADPCTEALRANAAATFADLQQALAADPGNETFIVLAYPNIGLATGQGPATEIKALGSDHTIACAGTGAQLGLDDVLAQEAASHGALLANPYAAFTAASVAAGDSFRLHPNAIGHQQIADAFLAATAPCVAR